MGCGSTKFAGHIQINTIHGDSMDGMSSCPGTPLGYVAEGKTLTMQYNPATFTLTNAVEQKGITAEDWATICESLRKGKGMTGIGGGFSKAIKAANDDYFLAKGLEAVYAEYGKGQKCMIVYAKGAVPS